METAASHTDNPMNTVLHVQGRGRANSPKLSLSQTSPISLQTDNALNHGSVHSLSRLRPNSAVSTATGLGTSIWDRCAATVWMSASRARELAVTSGFSYVAVGS